MPAPLRRMGLGRTNGEIAPVLSVSPPTPFPSARSRADTPEAGPGLAKPASPAPAPAPPDLTVGDASGAGAFFDAFRLEIGMLLGVGFSWVGFIIGLVLIGGRS